MQDEIHLSKTGCCNLFFLAVDCNINRRFICRTDKQRTRTARRIINRCIGIGHLVNSDDLCKNSWNFSRCIKLSFAFTALCCKITHKILIRITENIITTGLVTSEIKFRTLKNGNKSGEFIHHLVALAKFGFVVKMSVIYDTAELIVFRIGKLGNDFVHFLTDIFISFNCNKVVKASAFRDCNIRVLYTFELVGYIFNEQKCQNVILVLRGIHTSTKLIAACPQGTV